VWNDDYIYIYIKKRVKHPPPWYIELKYVTMSFNSNANIYFSKTCVPMKIFDHTGVTVKYDIEIQCTWTISPMYYPKFSMFTLQICVFKSSVLRKKYLFSVNIVRRRISEAQILQIIGMRPIGISFKAIERRMDYYYTIVSRLVRKHTQANTAEVLPRSGRPHVMSHR
jgi:hypothetical protein